MNFKHILSEIEKVDPEVYEKLDTRRASLRSFSGIGKKIAAEVDRSCNGRKIKSKRLDFSSNSFRKCVRCVSNVLRKIRQHH